jgi:hypothetical protein
MPHFTPPRLIPIFLAIILMLPGCAAQKPEQAEELYKLNSIVVLPSDIITHEAEGPKSNEESLKDGAFILDEIMAEYLAPDKRIRFISPEQQDTLLTEYNQGRAAQALSLGKKLQVDAVLLSRVNRYRERSGQNYSIDDPASVSFEYRLMLVETGQTLCAGVFDETQQSLSEDLLSFRKAFKRGGKWITVRELAKEGVEKKFGTCRFLVK